MTNVKNLCLIAVASMKILVLDDNPQQLLFLQWMLSKRGYETVAASNEKEVMEALRSSQIGLLIIEIRLGGYELCRDIKKKYNLPIIILTDKPSTPTDVLHAFESGADDFVMKSEENDLLFNSIKRNLN